MNFLIIDVYIINMYASVFHAHSAHGSQKTVPDTTYLELLISVSHNVYARNWIQVL